MTKEMNTSPIFLFQLFMSQTMLPSVNETMNYSGTSEMASITNLSDLVLIENTTQSNDTTDPAPKVDFIFEFLVPAVFLNGVGMLGLVGNLLSIFILSRPQMKGSTNCILIGLATYDSILIISRYCYYRKDSSD